MAPQCLSEFQHGAWAHSLTAQRHLERRARQAGGEAQVLQTHAAGGAGCQHPVPPDDYDKASMADQRTKRVIVHGQLASGISGRTNRCISRASLQTDRLPSAFRRPSGPTTEANKGRTLNSALEAKYASRLPITFRPSPKTLPTVAKAPSDHRTHQNTPTSRGLENPTQRPPQKGLKPLAGAPLGVRCCLVLADATETRVQRRL